MALMALVKYGLECSSNDSFTIANWNYDADQIVNISALPDVTTIQILFGALRFGHVKRSLCVSHAVRSRIPTHGEPANAFCRPAARHPIFSTALPGPTRRRHSSTTTHRSAVAEFAIAWRKPLDCTVTTISPTPPPIARIRRGWAASHPNSAGATSGTPSAQAPEIDQNIQQYIG